MNLCKKSTIEPYSFFVIHTTLPSYHSLRFEKNLSETILKLIMTINDKITDEKPQYDINKEVAKTLALFSGKIDKYKYLTGEEIFLPDQSRVIEQAKFTYFLLGIVFEKQIKTIEDEEEKQIKALGDHGKQLDRYNYKKQSLAHSKQKEIYKDIINSRIDEIQDLSKQMDFNNLTYH